jgi:hypothetical protein
MKFCGHTPTYKTTSLHTVFRKNVVMEFTLVFGLSRWPCYIRRGSAATRLLGLRVRITPRTWMFFCCKCCALSGRGLCETFITHPEESYRLQYVVVCDLETPRMRTSWPASGRSTTKTNREEWGSNIGPAILRIFLWLSSVSPEKCHDSTSNQATGTSFTQFTVHWSLINGIFM